MCLFMFPCSRLFNQENIVIAFGISTKTKMSFRSFYTIIVISQANDLEIEIHF